MSTSALVRRVASDRLKLVLVRGRFYARPPGGSWRPINARAAGAALRAGRLVDGQSFDVTRGFRMGRQLHPAGTFVRILRPEQRK